MDVPAIVMEVGRGMKVERMRRFPSAALMVTVQALRTNEGRRYVTRAAMWMMWVELASLGS